MHISGLGGNFSAESGSIVNLQLSPPNRKMIHTTAVVLERLKKPLPTRPLRQINRDKLKGLQMADSSFNKPGEIDIILGGDVFEQVLGKRRLSMKVCLQEVQCLDGSSLERCWNVLKLRCKVSM